MGRADYLLLGDWNTVCYQCGWKRKASTMVRNWQGYYVCPEHNEPRQPQDFVRSVNDVQTPPWTQPDPAPTYGTTDYLVTEAYDKMNNDNTFLFYICTENSYPLETET